MNRRKKKIVVWFGVLMTACAIAGCRNTKINFDVRFIYVRDQRYYLGLQPRQDFIDWALDETPRAHR